MSAISRTVLREQVKDILLHRIVSGELKPGERLVETRIASELGTSQAPVREALRDLELLRMVESEPFRGARVREFGDDELIEVYPVRAVLEELAAKEAAKLLDGDVAVLEREVEEMRAAARRGDLNALVRHDIAFHRLMVEAAGNPVLEQCWKSLGVEGRITISLYGTYVEPDEAAEKHVPILEAIRSRKPGAAGREARKHVEEFARIARQRAKRRGRDPLTATRSTGAALSGLFLAALALRPQIVGVGPLIDEIQDDLDASHALVGLLGTIPVLCMGLFAPVAAYLSARLGTRRAMTIGLVLIGVFGVTRALAPSAWLVVLLTWAVGIGMGLGNALAPLAVRETVPERPATGTGVYTTGIQIGSTIAAALAVPLAAAARRLARRPDRALGRCMRRRRRVGGARARRRRPCPPRTRSFRGCRGARAPRGCSSRSSRRWGRRTTGSTRGCPDAYGERGWSDESAGLLLAAMNLTAIPCSFLVPWLSDRHGGRRPWLVGVSRFFAAGAIGLVAFPAAGYFWALLAGIAQGGAFALVMTLPLDFETTPERVGALVGMMLGVGYSIAAVSPFVLGAVRDATGSFDAVLWVCAAFLDAARGARQRAPAARASLRGRVDALGVLLDHPRGREARAVRAERALHHREPAARDPVGVAVVEERDHLLLEQVVQRVRVARVLRRLVLALVRGPVDLPAVLARRSPRPTSRRARSG